tara:strand:+ start:455 stop:649 length:195 start_codon:yes stop_codon:yes gene_type:complete
VTELTPEKMKQRVDALKILMAQFGSNPHLVYECTDDWLSKQVTNNGLVSYFKAYYSTEQNDETN